MPEPACVMRLLRCAVEDEWREMRHADALLVCAGGTLVRCHRLALAALSGPLRAALDQTPEAVAEASQNDPLVIHLPDADAELLTSVLAGAYLGGDSVAQVPLSLAYLRIGAEPLCDVAVGASVARKAAPEASAAVKLDSRVSPIQQPVHSEAEASPVEEVDTTKGHPPLTLEALIRFFECADAGGTRKHSFRCCSCGAVLKARPSQLQRLVRHLRELDDHEEAYRGFLSDVNMNEEAVEAMLFGRGRRQRAEDREDAVGNTEVEEERTCPKCHKVFAKRKTMMIHLKAVHSGLKPHVCKICGAAFARKESLDRHSHGNDNKPFLCSVCGKTFSRQHIRDIHEKAHFGDKRYPCTYCEKRFTTNQKRTVHERIHTGEKPFSCDVCLRKFVQKHQLQTHMLVHSGEKPYSCDKCSQSFRHLSTKARHHCLGRVQNTVVFETPLMGHPSATIHHLPVSLNF